MPRVLQALVFFGFLAGVGALAMPVEGGAGRFAVAITGSLVAVILVYVVPWVYFGLDTDPVRPIPDE